MRVLKLHDDVTSIEFFGPDISDQDLDIVRQIPGKKRVSIWAAPVTDRGMKTLAGCLDIRLIQLRGTLVTSAGIDSLQAINGLDGVHFALLQVFPKAALEDFTQTELEAFANHKFDQERVIASICTIRSLGQVYLEGLSLGQRDFRDLSTLPNLATLSLFHCSINEDSLPPLSKSSSLRFLCMPNTPVRNADIFALREIKGLAYVAMDTSRLDDTAVELIRRVTTLQRVLVMEGAAQQGLTERWNRQLSEAGIEVIEVIKETIDWNSVGLADLSASEIRLQKHAIQSMVLTLLPIKWTFATDANGSPFVVTAEVPDADAVRRPPGDAAAVWIGDLKTIRAVNLNDCHITDVGLRHLGGLKGLKKLWLRKTLITDEGVKHLEGLEHLEMLNLESTAVSDKACESLAKIRSLDALRLAFTKVTDDGVEVLLDGTNLMELDLEGTVVSGYLVPRLVEEEWLKDVSVGVTLMTPRDVERLRERRPDMQVTDRPRLLIPAK